MNGPECGVAAFFDLDGTLMPPPSLERRLLRELRASGAIPSVNYVFWLAHAVRLLCKGVFPIGPANKSYLRKLKVGDTASSGRRLFQSRRVAFFDSAIARVVEHVQQGHMIVIVSGTLPVLARPAARSLEAVVAAYGLATKVCTRATRLGRDGACWTGHIAGDAMFGAAKALAIRRLAARMNWDLRQCYGYGDSLSDRWMLETVGRPMAVNPSRGLERLARERRWPIVRWSSSHQKRHDSREEPIGSGAARSRSGRAL